MKSATINLAGRGLSHLFCDLRLNKSLGLKCNFIPGHLNKIADQISRVPSIPSSPPDFDYFVRGVPRTGILSILPPGPRATFLPVVSIDLRAETRSSPEKNAGIDESRYPVNPNITP